jgi:hypothetical protein
MGALADIQLWLLQPVIGTGLYMNKSIRVCVYLLCLAFFISCGDDAERNLNRTRDTTEYYRKEKIIPAGVTVDVAYVTRRYYGDTKAIFVVSNFPYTIWLKEICKTCSEHIYMERALREYSTNSTDASTFEALSLLEMLANVGVSKLPASFVVLDNEAYYEKRSTFVYYIRANMIVYILVFKL